jgi:hypothetical protein
MDFRTFPFAIQERRKLKLIFDRMLTRTGQRRRHYAGHRKRHL